MGASNRGRVAKNTLFLYLRQILVMVISLYTSRIILEALGIIEYGVYNVVAGVSFTFIFFSVALVASTQRFLTYTMGKGDSEELRRVFSMSFWMYLSLAILVVIIGGAVGSWIVKDILVIPPQLTDRAVIVFYFMIASLALTILGSVFESAVIAHEHMKIYAYIGIFEAVFKLVLAYTVFIVKDKLVVYAGLMALALLVPKIVLTIYCLKRYPECRPKWIFDKSLLKQMAGFTGWNVYAGSVYIFNEQGVNILLNLFFGPVVNAARGVAMQVNSAINSLCRNFFTAMQPQLIKSYAEGNMSEEIKLFSMGSRFSFFLVSCLVIPVVGRMDYILSLWLKEVPAHSVAFVDWTLVFLAFNTLNNPLRIVVHATGDLKRSAIEGDTIFLLALPLSYAVLAVGLPAWTVYPCLVVTRTLSNLTFLRIVKRAVGLPPNFYSIHIVLPIALATAVGILFTWGADLLFGNNFLGLILYGFTALSGCLGATFAFGLTSEERQALLARLHRLI